MKKYEFEEYSFETALHWYQKKIGSYDKQSWERSIEERVLNGLNAVPKKVARVKTELIDIDLIRGSAFTKAKPQQSFLIAIYFGFIRVILFPFYLKWWTNQFNQIICYLLFFLYGLQCLAIYVYYHHLTDDHYDDIPLSELIMPIIMFITLGAMQSQIVSSSSKSDFHNHRHHHHHPQRNHHHHHPQRHRSTCRSSSFTRHLCDEKETHLLNSYSSDEPYKSHVKRRVQWKKTRSDLNEDQQNFIFNSNIKVEPLYRYSKKSDEESGLESTDYDRRNNENISPPPPQPPPSTEAAAVASEGRKVPLQERRGLQDKLNITISNCAPNDYDMSHTNENEKHSASETEEVDADVADMSSLDDRSPYSTINSVESKKWESYKKIALQANKINKNTQNGSKKSKFAERLNVTKMKKHEKTNISKINSYSSGDSEGSLSPSIKRINSLLDSWPIINSENSSDEEMDVITVDEETLLKSKSNSTIKKMFTFDEYRPKEDLTASYLNCGDEFTGSSKDKTNDKVSCAIWQQNECQKVDLSVLDISSAIIRKVETVKHNREYFYLGFIFSLLLTFIPTFFRLHKNIDLNYNQTTTSNTLTNHSSINFTISSPSPSPSSKLPPNHSSLTSNEEQINFFNFFLLFTCSLGDKILDNYSFGHTFVISTALVTRFLFSLIFFFLLCVAERTFRERFLYAKYFCHLTSSRRAKRSELPHFRLNKVRNIKTWLSVRSYLKKHGPQRSIDVIVSFNFIIAVSLLTFLCIQLLREQEMCSEQLYCWEMVLWDLTIGIYIMRFIILGSKMNTKYRGNLSILITEQINLYLQMEQKPHKKEELNLANNVLKLAESLLKQLEVPFKISGFSANSYLYNITKVIVLSAFSAVLSELFGFKLKLDKIKLPA